MESQLDTSEGWKTEHCSSSVLCYTKISSKMNIIWRFNMTSFLFQNFPLLAYFDWRPEYQELINLDLETENIEVGYLTHEIWLILWYRLKVSILGTVILEYIITITQSYLTRTQPSSLFQPSSSVCPQLWRRDCIQTWPVSTPRLRSEECWPGLWPWIDSSYNHSCHW